MKWFLLFVVMLALVVQPGLARPKPKAKPHHHPRGMDLLKKKGLGATHTGTVHLHSHKGHHTYVTLKKGKVTRLHMKTPGGKTLVAKPVRRTAALPLDRGGTVRGLLRPDEIMFVSLDDTVPVRADGPMIRFTIQTPFFTISFWFPAEERRR